MSNPEHVSATLSQLKDSLASNLFSIPLSRALEIGVCVQCKKLVKDRCYSPAGLREYRISGLCELYFDEITGG